jgi:hypothetical protein
VATSHRFVIGANGKVVYAGAIDDQSTVDEAVVKKYGCTAGYAAGQGPQQ